MTDEELEDAIGRHQHALGSIAMFLKLATNNPKAIPMFDRAHFVNSYLVLGAALSRLPKPEDSNVVNLAPFLHRQAAE
jgi:hypothetical protein